jgi:hypothetical protein
MSFTVEVAGSKGQPLTIDVSVGMRTARDLRSLMLDAAYALKGNSGTFLALLFKCGLTPDRLAKELSEFNGVVQPEFADRVQVKAISHPKELGAALHGVVKEDLQQELQNRIIEASTGGSPTSSSREVVLFLILRRWLLGLGPIKTAELAAQSGASAPTVSAAIKTVPEQDVVRTRDRKIALKRFSNDSWQKWLSKSAEVPTVRYVDRSGSPRSPEKLVKKLLALGRNDVAVGGVLGATHHYPAIDITGAPRLDILIHGTHHADLSFIEQLDPGLERDDSPEGHALVVVHFTNRCESYFEVQNGLVWADALDCLVHLWKAGLTHQVEDLITHLTRQAKQSQQP